MPANSIRYMSEHQLSRYEPLSYLVAWPFKGFQISRVILVSVCIALSNLGCCTEKITMIVFSGYLVVELLEAPGNRICWKALWLVVVENCEATRIA